MYQLKRLSDRMHWKLIEFQFTLFPQVSLTIFGVVGGPLLGLFTLGMLTESATETGSVSAATMSLAFLFWVAFGQPRPSPLMLPVPEGCHTNMTLSTMQQVTEFAQ